MIAAEAAGQNTPPPPGPRNAEQIAKVGGRAGLGLHSESAGLRFQECDDAFQAEISLQVVDASLPHCIQIARGPIEGAQSDRSRPLLRICKRSPIGLKQVRE